MKIIEQVTKKMEEYILKTGNIRTRIQLVLRNCWKPHKNYSIFNENLLSLLPTSLKLGTAEEDSRLLLGLLYYSFGLDFPFKLCGLCSLPLI